MRVKLSTLLCTFFAQLSIFCGLSYGSDTPFSKYGTIQNVQNYSSNPFWSPNAPYNQRMPTAVYATGPDVETSECQRIVSSLITTTCAMQNNCIELQLSDIRPTIMLQLSRMPGGNYATACLGYIEPTFNEYIEQFSIAVPTGVTAFPTGPVPNPGATESEYQIQNPYEIQLMDWQTDVIERKLELQQLQSMNGAGNEHIERASFPTTYADLSFSERMANSAAGYEPYRDKSAYKPIEIESQEEYLNRQQTLSNYNATGKGTKNTNSDLCKKNPNHPDCKAETPKPQLVENELPSVQDEILFIL